MHVFIVEYVLYGIQLRNVAVFQKIYDAETRGANDSPTAFLPNATLQLPSTRHPSHTTHSTKHSNRTLSQKVLPLFRSNLSIFPAQPPSHKLDIRHCHALCCPKMKGYRIELSPSKRAGCQNKDCKDAKIKIQIGELRFGVLVEVKEHTSMQYRHW